MGAANFMAVGTGKDSREVFTRLVKEAAHEYGHGGYTGTIAEKDGYVNCGELPARLTPRRLEELVFVHEEWTYEQADIKAGYRKGRTRKNPVPEQYQALVRKVYDAGYADKWEAAAMVEVTSYALKKTVKERLGRKGTQDRVFVFMGMASE